MYFAYTKLYHQELIVKGITKGNNTFKLTKKLMFLPGFKEQHLLNHSTFLQTSDFSGAMAEMNKTMFLYSGSIKFTCKLNKSAYFFTADDVPVVSVDIVNLSKTRSI